MEEIKAVTVHCPKCLAEFEIKPVVKSIFRMKNEGLFVLDDTPKIVVSFEDFTIRHMCNVESEGPK